MKICWLWDWKQTPTETDKVATFITKRDKALALTMLSTDPLLLSRWWTNQSHWGLAEVDRPISKENLGQEAVLCVTKRKWFYTESIRTMTDIQHTVGDWWGPGGASCPPVCQTQEACWWLQWRPVQKCPGWKRWLNDSYMSNINSYMVSSRIVILVKKLWHQDVRGFETISVTSVKR